MSNKRREYYFLLALVVVLLALILPTQCGCSWLYGTVEYRSRVESKEIYQKWVREVVDQVVESRKQEPKQ